jgi:hypothetical protein
MRGIGWLQLAGAGVLMVTGLAATRRASASNGFCPNSGDGYYMGSRAWGQELVALGDNPNQFVDTLTLNGVHDMWVQFTKGFTNGNQHYNCLDGEAYDNNNNFICANHADANGTSQLDSTGDCNRATSFAALWFIEH